MPQYRIAPPLLLAALAINASGADTAIDPPDPSDAPRALDRAVADLPSARSSARGALIEAKAGPATVRLIGLSFGVLTAVGTSTADDDGIGELQAGSHDPKRRGFTFQQSELLLYGAVDPHLNAEAHIVFVPGLVELEEAFATSTSLPEGLQAKAGYFLTEFGRTNPQHPHAWPWLTQPVVNSRLMGGDGLRGPGARIAWLTPLAWYCEAQVGIHNADDGSMVSFRGGEDISAETVGGRPAADDQTVHQLDDMLFTARWVNSWDASASLVATIGLSAALGPNTTGDDGDTLLTGADLLVKWQGGATGIRSVVFQSEIIARRYRAGAGVDPDDGVTALPAATLDDWGVTTQVLAGFGRGWRAGLRHEFLSGSGDSFAASGDGATPGAFVDRSGDPARADRQRISPLITWNPSEFARLRLEYDYDRADHRDDDEHSVWLGFEFLIGAHPAHRY